MIVCHHYAQYPQQCLCFTKKVMIDFFESTPAWIDNKKVFEEDLINGK